MPRIAALALCGFLLAASGLRAEPMARLVGGQAGFAFGGGDATPWLGFQISRIPRRGIGVELGVGTAPVLVALAGGVVLLPDLDAVLTLPAGPKLSLLLRGGGSAIAVAGGGGVGAVPGFNFGASLLVHASPRHGLRLDFTRRSFGGDAAFSSLTLGFVAFGGAPLRR